MKEYSTDEAKVLRDGHLFKTHASELVPGDIIEIAVGDKIPADSRLLKIHSSSFRVDQAILTGESVSVNKDIEAVDDPRAVKQDQTNILFSVTLFLKCVFFIFIFKLIAFNIIGNYRRIRERSCYSSKNW